MNVLRGVVEMDIFRFCDDSISGSKMHSRGAEDVVAQSKRGRCD
jgi:hypothetical protein